MARSLRPDLPLLTDHLIRLRAEWAGRRLDSDPLVFPHRYRDPVDQEVVALLSSSLAFGRVASIQASLERLLAAMGPSPSRFLLDFDGRTPPALRSFVHRWVGATEITAFLTAIARVLREYRTLGALFAAGDEPGEDYIPALDRFFGVLRQEACASGATSSHGLRFLLPTPGKGSASKRAHLFLRWTVRTEDLDLGLWTGGLFDPARLLLPMDTHVHRIATYLGLTRRKTADLEAAREATTWLRRVSPGDPVAYDWALSRLGILAECVRERTRRHCERCAVRPVCRVAILPLKVTIPKALRLTAAGEAP
ncbi:MAG: TIGR02757 family protein [Thermoanaerobaculia bacterium]